MKKKGLNDVFGETVLLIGLPLIILYLISLGLK